MTRMIVAIISQIIVNQNELNTMQRKLSTKMIKPKDSGKIKMVVRKPSEPTKTNDKLTTLD